MRIKALASVGKFALNRLGFMTEKQIAKTTLKVGSEFAKAARSGCELSDELLSGIVRGNLPKGIKAPDLITFSKDKVIEFANANNYRNMQSVPILNGARGMFGKRLNNKSYLWVKNTNDNLQMSSTTAHELRHALDELASKRKFSIFYPIQRIRMKFVDSNKIKQQAMEACKIYRKLHSEASRNIHSVLGNNKFFDTPNNKSGLFKQLNISEEEFGKYCQRRIYSFLKPDNHKENISLLRYLTRTFDKEKRAFKAGGDVLRELKEVPMNASSADDYKSLFEGELANACKKELKTQIKALKALKA